MGGEVCTFFRFSASWVFLGSGLKGLKHGKKDSSLQGVEKKKKRNIVIGKDKTKKPKMIKTLREITTRKKHK